MDLKQRFNRCDYERKMYRIRDGMKWYRTKWLHLTQKEAGELAGLAQRTVSHYETGDIMFSPELFLAYSNLGFDIHTALRGDYK